MGICFECKVYYITHSNYKYINYTKLETTYLTLP